jgi:aspartyl-tRNA(Asn)/glutamyl-tRNA(Gln) amidotransferase subunit A
VVAAVEATLQVFEDLGAVVEEMTLPDMNAAYTVGTVTIAVEGAAFHAADLRERPELFSAELRASFELAGFYSGVDYVQAQRLRRHLMQATEQAMAGFDAVIMPTSPVAATPILGTPPEHAMLRPRNTMPFNVLGLPAISVPCGFTRDGLPVGLQIVGKAFDEAGILGIAHAYEQATEWHRRRPPL